MPAHAGQDTRPSTWYRPRYHVLKPHTPHFPGATVTGVIRGQDVSVRHRAQYTPVTFRTGAAGPSHPGSSGSTVSGRTGHSSALTTLSSTK